MKSLPAGSLIVSCQARIDNPLHGPVFMAAMAQAAEAGGAVGFRADGAVDIAAIRAVSALPIIGIQKTWTPGFEVYITPDFASAASVVAAGADIVALDATQRRRAGEPIAQLIGRIRSELGAGVFADVASLEDGLAAEAAGADYVATTLAGYTDETAHRKAAGPDLELLAALVAHCRVPVVAEGRFDTPELAGRALQLGAHAVVVGTMITNPREITRRFVTALGAKP